MSPRAISWLAWSLAALCVVLFLVAVALQVATLPVRPPSSWGTGGISTPLWAIFPFLPDLGRSYRLQAPRESYRLDLSGRRHHLDASTSLCGCARTHPRRRRRHNSHVGLGQI